MKAGPVEIGTLLQNRNRYCVPIYQRHYVWNREKQWEPFWQDIRTKAVERLAGRERRFSHFMGAIVLESRAKPSVKQVPSFQVVDGQQRLTTFQLFLTAARHYAQSIGHETIRSRTAPRQSISTLKIPHGLLVGRRRRRADIPERRHDQLIALRYLRTCSWCTREACTFKFNQGLLCVIAERDTLGL